MPARNFGSIVLLGLFAATAPAAPALADGAVELSRPTDASSRLELVLDPSLAPSWREVNVGRLVVQTPGQLRRLDLALSKSRHLEVDLAEARSECALVVAELGPAGEKGHSSSWQRITRASKLMVCPAGHGADALAARRRAGAALTARTGGRVEIRPLFNPATVRVGRDLAVRLYHEGEPRSAVEVVATGSGGRRLRARTDAAGVAVIRIPASGAWRVSYSEETYKEETYEASFSFDVLPEAAWRVALEKGALAAAPDFTARTGAPGAWRFLGPAPVDDLQYAGRVAALAVSATRPDRYYAAAASGGVWTTENGGHTWRALSDDLPTLAMGSVTLDPNDERRLYAGSGESHNAFHSFYGLGVYRSANRGHSWDVLAYEDFAGRTVSRLAVAPDGTVWATVGRAGGNQVELEGAKLHPDRSGPFGLFRSDDGGDSWTAVTAGLPQITANDLDPDPNDPNRMTVCFSEPYGDVANGCYLSVDGGASFQSIFIAGAFLGRSDLAIAPSDSNRLYLVVTTAGLPFSLGGFPTTRGLTFGVFRSDDGGATFQATGATGNFHGTQGNYDSAVVVHPTDPDTVFVAGVSVLRSSDGGATWQNVTPPHVDVHDLRFDAAGRLLAATDGGVYRSEDLGDSWEARNRKLGNLQFYAGLASDPSNRHVILGGTQDNGTVRRTSPSTAPSTAPSTGWSQVLGADGGYTAVSPLDPDVFFVELQVAGNLFRTDDGGLSFTLVGSDIEFEGTAFQAPFLIDPNDPQRLLYGAQRVWESTDLGLSWTPISTDLTDGDPLVDFFGIRSLVIAPSNSQTVYATTNNQRLLVSVDGGSSWTLARDDVYGWPRIMRQIAVDPLDDAAAYVAVGRFGGEKVLRTSDRGQTWVSIGGDLPDLPVNTVAVARSHGDRLIFAGTDRGVFLSRDEGTTWRPFSRRLPNAPVTDLLVDDTFDRLIAGTLGRGVWTVRLPR